MQATIHYAGVILDLALNNGVNPMNGKVDPKDRYLNDMQSLDEVRPR